MFSSWQVPCGIADYTAQLVSALQALENIEVSVVPFDRRPHPRADYVEWGRLMNGGDIAHVQHEYSFYGYLLPWHNYFGSFIAPVQRPLVITKHVSFDGPLLIPTGGLSGLLRQVKWALYNRWLGPYATYLNRDTFAGAHHVIVLTDRLKNQLVARGLQPESISVIPAGVPTLPVAEGGDRLRADWGWQDKHILGHFGFIAEAKGHRIGVEALRHLPDHYVLLIAGGARRPADEAVLEGLCQRIAELGLQARVRITGYLTDEAVPAHLSACDALVYPNTHADFSYSVYVGLAHQAAPVILSDIAPHRELATEGVVAFFENGRAEALANTVRVVVEDPARHGQMMDAAQVFIRQHSWASAARQTRDVYARLLQP